MFSIIAAIGKNNELGYKGDLIWHLPNDLKFFKKTTTGKTIVMGENTFKSLGRILPNRHHIVLSENNNFPEEVEVFANLDDFLNKYKSIDDEIFIIGGAMVYGEFIDICDKMYLTEIDDEFKEATVYFPKFNKKNWTKEILYKNSDDGIKYKHVLYKRKKGN